MPGFADTEAAAEASAQRLDDPRVRHFHDPVSTHLAGKAFAEGLIAKGRGVAWDIYLFYGKDAEWGDGPPAPTEYLHQLGGGRRADAKQFRTGADLVKALHEAMHKVTGASCKGE